MKLKFRKYSRITFIFSWLKYEEILKTHESQVGWLLQKMALKVKLSFFWTSDSEGHGSHGKKGTILFLGSVNVPMSVIFTKLYFVEMSWVHQKL